MSTKLLTLNASRHARIINRVIRRYIIERRQSDRKARNRRKALARALKVQEKALDDAARAWERNSEGRASMVHIGTANRKTGCFTEGTLAVITCSKVATVGPHACAPTCYALWHEDRIYTNCRKNHAENTVARRACAYEYYGRFFAAVAGDRPNKFGDRVIRLNETGDFESVEQLRAAFDAARNYPELKILAYTRRYEFLAVANERPSNFQLAFSAFTCPAAAEMLKRAGVPVTRVVDNGETCPAQKVAAIAKRTGKACAWSCAMCAHLGLGCWSKAGADFRKH